MEFNQEFLGDFIQIGRTTEQIRNAPKSAIFIWCEDNAKYAKNLATSLHREDLTIAPKCWMTEKNLRGNTFTDIVVDHATVFNHEQQVAYLIACRLTNV